MFVNMTGDSPFAFAMREADGTDGTGGSGEADKGGADTTGAGTNTTGGDKGAPWYNVIPEGPARDHVAAKGYKDPAALAEANYNLTRLHTGSTDVIAVPGKDAKPEDLKAFYNKVNGVPEAVVGYDDALKFGDDVKVDPEFVGAAKGWFLEAGLRPEQAKFLADKWNAYGQQVMTKQAGDKQAADAAAVDQVRAKFDANGKGAFDQVIANGQKAVQGLKLSTEQLARLDAANGVAANIELLAAIGAAFGNEAGFHLGENVVVNTPESARVEIGTLSADKAFQDSLLDKRHPMHTANTQKWNDLQKRAYAKAK